MMRFDTVLFDLDGTISDSGLGITRSVAYALSRFGIQVEDIRSLERFVGPPLADSFRDFYHFTLEQCAQGIAWYREYYREKGIHETECYPGICALLRRLHDSGRAVALATSKPTVFAEKIIEEYGVTDCFDLILGCELDGRRGKKTEVMTECLQRLGITKEKKDRTVMVGDRNYDVDGAKYCGIHSIAVTYGYAPPGELEAAGPDFTVHSTEQLAALLLNE